MDMRELDNFGTSGINDICIPNKPDMTKNCVIKTIISLR